MSNQAQVFLIRAYPAPNHPLYHEFQTAQLIICVGEDDQMKAIDLAKEKLTEEGWIPISFESESTLTEDYIKDEGGTVWEEAYNKAKSGDIFFEHRLDEDFLYSSKSGISPDLPSRITETFIDEVIEEAGGHRLSVEEANPDETRNPDYRIDNFLIELKDLQKEGLHVESRRKKLAKLLRESGGVERLSGQNYSKWLDILGGPVKENVRSAAHQIRQAKEYMGDNTLKGGLLYINTGYYTLSHDIFCQIVEKMVRQYKSEIDLVMCISNMVHTNGFESMNNFKFYPGKGENPVEDKIHSAFLNKVGNLMNDWGKEGFKSSSNPAAIIKPYVFEDQGEYYGFEPEILKCSVNKNKK
jgi:hypothetical protein